MKILIGIVFFLVSTSNSLCSPTDSLKNKAENAVKGSNANHSLPISNIPITSRNNDSTVVSNTDSTKLSSSPSAVKKQKDQNGCQSDAHSKNTVPPSIKETKSPENIQTLRIQSEISEKTETMEQSSSKYNQTGAKERIPKGQEPQVANGPKLPKSKHPDYEAKVKEIKHRESPTLGAEWQERNTEDKVVTGHDVPEEKRTQSCSMVWPECSKRHLDDTVFQVAKDLMTFTLNLFQTLSAADFRPNIVVSPISVALALSHLMLGTDGKTKNDILNSLFKSVKEVNCTHEAMQNLTTHDSFLSAAEIFYKKELTLNEKFIDQSSKLYGSKGIPLPKDKKKSLEKINSWVSQRTKHLIPTLLQDLPSDLQLILVNVIHYQGKWLSQFDPELTRNENFHRPSLGSVKVPIMNAHKYPLQILKDSYLQAQVARFPLSDNCSLLIFLPLTNEVDALKTMEKRLNQEIVSLLMTHLEEVAVKATSVSLPHLKLDTNFDLNEALSSLGLYDLFEYPNLCALSNSTDLVVSDVHHHAFLEMKEEGVKAAAASTITIARTVTVFAVRRPFLFILVSDNTKVPILIGHIKDPSQ
ncbi:plasma protease C1 inhibitor [Pyxicephalus adspersus]|uniref:plasma protease C1 inhibitor n=1 Tax=Pyxicephalus adspersus TaxID=30357 RepID=UPI003B59998D